MSCHATVVPPKSVPHIIYDNFLAVGGPRRPCMAATDGPLTIYSAISGPLLPQIVPHATAIQMILGECLERPSKALAILRHFKGKISCNI